MEVAPGVYLIGSRIACSNSVLIKDDECILIDPGTTSYWNLAYLLRKLTKLGVRQIDKVLLTHAHPDHSQAVRFIKSEYGAKFYCHPIARRILEARRPFIPFLQQQIDSATPLLDHLFPDERKLRRFIEFLTEAFSRWYTNFITLDWSGVEVDGTFEGGDEINGWRVLSLPGHAPEEVGFYRDGIIITGDLLGGGKLFPIAVLNMPSSDMDDALRSMEVMRKIDPKIIVPGHGDALIDPKSVISQRIEKTEELKRRAIKVLRSSSNPYLVPLKWWPLYPPGTILQMRLSMLGVLAKSALLKKSDR